MDVTLRGNTVPFVEALLDVLLEIDKEIPGYAQRTADALMALGGTERYEPHYEQILQRLAEVHVVAQVVRAPWPTAMEFEDEPIAPGSAKNPELVARGEGHEIGFEVKAPSPLAQERSRRSRPVQAGGRVFTRSQTEHWAGGPKNLTLPRDNAVKDFLLSADAKFQGFRAENSEFVGVLVVVWDDFIFEPITSLVHPASGLFTPNSFAFDADGPTPFASVDGVVVVSHLRILKNAMAEDGDTRPFEMGRQAFAYALDPARPPAYIPNPYGRGVPQAVREVLKAQPLEQLSNMAEYHPQDLIHWWDEP